MADNVYSNAKVVSKKDDVEEYKLGTFMNNQQTPSQSEPQPNNSTVLSNPNQPVNMGVEPLLNEIKNLHMKLDQIT